MATNSSNGQMQQARLLVLGYRGTLRPAESTASKIPRSSGENAFPFEELPPAMEALLQPWLAQASQLLTQRVPQQHRVFQGEPVPLDSLMPLIKDGLIGILTQAVGALGMEADKPSASDLFREFPLLAPLVRNAVSESVAAIATFLRRLHQDQSWLAAALQCRSLPPIDSITGTASDSHAGGPSVLRVRFQSGGCLYYKPRPVTGEWLWHVLLDAMARLDPQLHLPAARVFTREADSRYGWMESVFSQETRFSDDSDGKSASDVPTSVEYWRAAGAMLCLAQHVRLTDLHLANIVATPRGPAVTDAECLATPNLRPSRSEKSSQQAAAFSDALQAILNTGLLPRNQDSGLPDISGLFGHAAPVSGIRIPAWSLSSQGRYQLDSIGAELVDHHNAATETTPIAILPQMLSGYRHAADLLLHARKSLLAPGSPWRAVLEKRHAPRIVVRNTLTYGWLLSRSLEPHYLRSFYRRRNIILSELQPRSGQNLQQSLLRAELAAILQLHIPRFAILPGSRTLATGSGRAIARRFTASTPAYSVFESIETLSSENLEIFHIPALLSAVVSPMQSQITQC